MPLGLYTSCEVSAPCGLCSKDGVIGLLDVPDTFLDPDRMRAGLLWFTRGFVEYQFPNNATLANAKVGAVELAMELSSEVPGHIEGLAVGHHGRHQRARDRHLDGAGRLRRQARQAYARLVEAGRIAVWRPQATGASPKNGTYRDGAKVSKCSLADLELERHRSIRIRIGVKEDARHPGGINIFGSGFGNYSKDIVLRLLKA